MKNMLIATLLLVGLNAHAYKTGTYSCQNTEKNLPKNVYRITDSNVTGSDKLPYLEVTRYYSLPDDAPGAPAHQSVIRGLASIFTGETPNEETLVLGHAELTLVDGEPKNCK
jgi:hypothetical protein